MLRKAQFDIRLETSGENGEDLVRQSSEGAVLVQDGDVMLRYAEPDNEGTATLLLTQHLADLKRKGRIQARLTFITGQLQDTFYTTPLGSLNLSIFTHAQQFAFNDEGGEFVAHYSILIDGAHTTDNRLSVKWRYLS